jgi:hypothetical protein
MKLISKKKNAHWQCAHQLRLCAHLQFYDRDAMLPSVPVVASDRDPAHDPNLSASNFPMESLKEPHVLSNYNPAF